MSNEMIPAFAAAQTPARKLSDSDYSELKASYTQRALAVMRSAGAAVCDVCGARPEGDAQFCSNCGRKVSR